MPPKLHVPKLIETRSKKKQKQLNPGGPSNKQEAPAQIN